MRPQIALIRAIGAEFSLRKFSSFIMPLAVAGIVIIVLSFWLVSMNTWWLLVCIPVLLLELAGVVFALIVHRILKAARPDMNAGQATSVKDFVNKLERVAGTLQTPMFIIVYRVIRDSLYPRGQTFIASTTKDGTTLHKDFIQLERDFINKAHKE